MKLADNEFYVLKIIGKIDAYYGDGTNTLRGVKLYKTLKRAQEAQNGFNEPTEIMILTMNIRKL